MTQDLKDRIQYGSAVAMIASSIALAFASFAVLHLVHSTVLAFVGEAVGFASAVFGLSVFARSKSRELNRRFGQLEQNIHANRESASNLDYQQQNDAQL
ncbi:MAG: hypothetical protein IJT30_00150 [Muribaculaceae bacterium]|nr:hypothetical protein [Muribaculaceae bacterium]